MGAIAVSNIHKWEQRKEKKGVYQRRLVTSSSNDASLYFHLNLLSHLCWGVPTNLSAFPLTKSGVFSVALVFPCFSHVTSWGFLFPSGNKRGHNKPNDGNIVPFVFAGSDTWLSSFWVLCIFFFGGKYHWADEWRVSSVDLELIAWRELNFTWIYFACLLLCHAEPECQLNHGFQIMGFSLLPN